MKSIFQILLFTSFLLADTRTVAISYFDNTSGLEEYNPLSKGLADMLITDLSNVKSIQIVEREKLESLLKEIELGEGKFMDESTVQKLGKGLGADIILTGAFLSIEPDMRIDARLIDVETGKIIKANKVLGKSSDFFILVSQLSTQLINNLNLTYENEFTSKVKTIDIDDVVEYSQAINLLDNGYELEAQKKLMKIVQNNPEFGLAYKKLDNLSGRIKLIQIEKEKIREEKINDRISKIDIKDDYFACEVVALASEIRSWDESMLFMKNIKDLGVDSSKECAISIKEEFMYIEFMYYSLYKI